MGKALVIVESPTKAKTLRRFLGSDYIVESSVGHIRDLPASASEIPPSLKKHKWTRTGVNVEDDFKPLYVIHPDKKKVIAELQKKLKQADELLLATDEDREGEAISWHLTEVLKPKIPVRRMVFHEITKTAIKEALDHTRTIDDHLVEAQETRRIIDRLYGYEVSPILWRKIRHGLSAGRVQSVAIRMLVEREQARIRFRPAHYWDLSTVLRTSDEKTFPARLTSLDGRRLAGGKSFDPDTGKLVRDDVHHLLGDEAASLRDALLGAELAVAAAEEKPFSRAPAPPFTTSTLQQEGNRQLRFDAKRTMRAAQALYENGFITYMRTDSVTLSTEGLKLAREMIREQWGEAVLPAEPRIYTSKVKNAQEAHEAIRPVGEPFPSVAEVQEKLGSDPAQVYGLILKRTLASQMENARGRRMTVRVEGVVANRAIALQATGSVIDFKGFLEVYEEGQDEPEEGEGQALLPPVAVGDRVVVAEAGADDHVTQPPARLTEASLVKALEESGIGRPSTYASIIDTIQRRDYTFKKGNALVPTYMAFAVVNLMRQHLTHLVDTDFTARMEEELDAIARGESKSLPYLKQFYFGNGVLGLKPLLEEKAEQIDPRIVCSIPLGRDAEGREVVIRIGRWGPYVQRGGSDEQPPEQRVTLPEGICPDELTIEKATELLDRAARGQEPLGIHPPTGLPIFVKTGRFGPYVQLGTAVDGGEKPKIVSLLPDMKPETLTLAEALELLELPRTLGTDAEGVAVEVHLGRYGPYIRRGKDTRSLEEGDHVLRIGLERALVLLSQEKKRGRRAQKELKRFEKVEALDGVDLRVLEGRYGPYVTDGEYNSSLPRGADPNALSEPEAVSLILEAKARGPSRKGKKKKKAGKKVAAAPAAEAEPAGAAPEKAAAKKRAARPEKAAAAEDEKPSRGKKKARKKASKPGKSGSASRSRSASEERPAAPRAKGKSGAASRPTAE